MLDGVGLAMPGEREAEDAQFLMQGARNRHEGDDEVALGDEEVDDVRSPPSFADAHRKVPEVVSAGLAPDVV
jgi:hypothetical protein